MEAFDCACVTALIHEEESLLHARAISFLELSLRCYFVRSCIPLLTCSTQSCTRSKARPSWP